MSRIVVGGRACAFDALSEDATSKFPDTTSSRTHGLSTGRCKSLPTALVETKAS